MFGIILFWIQYIVAAILLYHSLWCIYVKVDTNKSEYNRYRTYKITENDERLKSPLWMIILFFTVFFVPFLNLTTYAGYLCYRLINDRGSEYNKYYCKSIFTKKY